ncbi:phosphonate metabolism protein/1,5-bisphosphokinase (PRPP-forming) PhnN [Niveibacterium sp. SC-1]|uniref:phosphonate metabolism protein/1,5-bisphosphokinase (PRPP-forming) PhnN n=1 Tax=Niveibacterium sp. SC-1 TaxID=3135646 RepID=UPI00311DFFB7
MGARLVYVVGASGVGKDSVLAALRASLQAGERIAVAHRYITRPVAAEGENHVALSEAEFHLRREAGCFALCWESHGLHYGVGREIEHWLAQDLTVLVNGSRAYWPEARRRFGAARLVEITASAETLRARLARRGRESAPEQALRLARTQQLAREPWQVDHSIRNESTISDAAWALKAWLGGLEP